MVTSQQEKSIFKNFGYGLSRLKSGWKLRNVIENSSPPVGEEDKVSQKRHPNDRDFVETVFNGDCTPVDYIGVGHGCAVAAFFNKETGKVKIVPKTLYFPNQDRPPVDLKKRGGLFWNSDLSNAIGKEAARDVMDNYKNLKLLVHSNPKQTADGYQPEKDATAMVNGRANGKTFIAKIPNAMLNLAIFYVSPLLYFVTGGRTAHSKTNELRKELDNVIRTDHNKPDKKEHRSSQIEHYQEDTNTKPKSSTELKPTGASQLNPIHEKSKSVE
jgi:hypothetical protein